MAAEPVVAVVAVERLARGAQRVEQRSEQPPALGQQVLEVRRAAAQVAPLDERVALHVA